MLWSTYNINWNDIQTHKKRGTAVYKRVVPPQFLSHADMTTTHKFLNNYKDRLEITIDQDIPIFTQDRNFIDKHVFVGE